MEGWLSDYHLLAAFIEFEKGSYTHLVTVGGNLPGSTENMANISANKLINLGINSKKVTSVPSDAIGLHKTYNSYLALKNWMDEFNINIKSINIFTIGVHARKSFTFAKKVLDKKISLGIISSNTGGYNSKYWFFSIHATRLVFRNMIGYIYALFFRKL